jgi:exopolysaccharide production protein ExoZ
MGGGGTGVDLFFVLSGFLIYGAVRKPRLNAPRFFSRRVQRIYPAFLAVFLVYLAISPFLGHADDASGRYGNRIPDTLIGSVMYVTSNLIFLPGIFPIQPIMNVAWSLSYEWFFYLSLPLLIFALAIPRWNRRTRTAFFLLGTCLFIAVNFLFPEVFYFASNPRQPTHIRAIMFAGGILLYEIVESRMFDRMGAKIRDYGATLLALGAVLLSGLVTVNQMNVTLTGTQIVRSEALVSGGLFIGYSALVLIALLPGTKLRGWLSNDYLRWLGNMSYSFYLAHGLPLHAFGIVAAKLHLTGHGVTATWIIFFAALPFVFIATTLFCAILFLAVEKPFSLGKRKGHTAVLNPQLEAKLTA